MTPTSRFLLYYAIYVGALHAVDGPWRSWRKGQVVDLWTLTHVGWSAAAQRMGVPLGTLMGLAAANEVGEFLVRRNAPHLLFGSPEGPANVAADLLANWFGYRVAEAFRKPSP